MKTFILLSLLSNSLFAASWKAADFSVNLTATKDGDWLSSDCLKECKIESLARKNLKLKNLDSSELQGGVNPGSVICKRIGAEVIYLKFETTSQAFCALGSSVISLSRLIRLI